MPVTPAPPSPVSHGLVTGIDICRTDGFTRHYTDPEKVDAVLFYLRLLRPLGPVSPSKEETGGHSYEIVVHLQDGRSRVHRQHSDCYAVKDQGYWGVIDPEIGQCLPLLMAQFPSDPTL